MTGWLSEAGPRHPRSRDLAPPEADQSTLTVSLWLAQDPRVVTDWPLLSNREVA
jgi:hypothetical protein